MNFKISKLLHKKEEVFSPLLLINLRWFILIILSLLMLFFVEAKAVSLPQFMKVVTMIGLVAIFNNWQYHMGNNEEGKVFGNLFQILLDLFFISTLVFMVGGNRNPFVILICMIVFIAPLFLNTFKNILVFILCLFSIIAQSYSTSLFWHTKDFLELDVTTLIIITTISWGLTTWLAKILKSTRDYLEYVMKREMRVSRLHSIGSLTSGFCHELGTPLGTMRMRLDRLVEGRGGESDLKVLDESLVHIERSLAKMVEHSNNDNRLDFSLISVAGIIKDSIDDLRSANVDIMIDNKIKDFSIEGATLSLRRIFYDLFENSYQAGASKIEISSNSEGEYNTLVVQDDGSGFPNTVLENFGSPFNTTKEKGMGIGLYNALTYLELLDGTLKIENSPAAKVTFYFKKV